jgi:hypothetical protein
MAYDLPGAANRVSHASLRLVRSEPPRLCHEIPEPPPRAPQPFWPRLSRALTLLGIGAVAHTLLPTNTTLPNVGLMPAPKAQQAPARVEPRVEVDRSTIVAPLRPGVVPAATLRDRQAVAAPSSPLDAPVALALIRSNRMDVPPAVGTTGVMPAADTASLDRPEADAPAAERDVPIVTEAASTTSDAERRAPAPDSRLASAAPAVSTPVVRVDDEDLVRRLLHEFTGAFERLDVTATKAVWPSVDDRKLRRAYEQLAAQRLSLESCGITISGRTANARCQGSATYQPKIGTRPVQIASREWMFDLSKQDAAWHIVNTVVR